MLLNCEKIARVFQGEPSEARAIQTQQGFTREPELHMISMKCQSIFGGAFQTAQVLSVSAGGDFGSIAPADSMLQHHKPASQGQINDYAETSASIGAIKSSKESHQLPTKDLVEDNVLEGTESRGATEGSTIFENSQTALASTSGQPVTKHSSPIADHPSGAFEKDSTPHGREYFMDLVNRCITDDWTRADCVHLCVGHDNMIPRWVPRSELPFYVDTSSFLTKEDAKHATNLMVAAATQWNRLGGNVPCFKQVGTIGAAVFQLKYVEKSDSKNGETAFARAFFPGDIPPTVYVYALSFKPMYRGYLVNIFCHELGHILGARHSFAPEGEPNVPCKILGERDPATVMQYPDHPSKLAIQESDARDMKTFYDLKDSHYLGCLIKDYSPQKLGQLPQQAKQPAGMDEGTGTKLANPQKVRMSDTVATKLKINALTRVAWILGFFTMGLWVGSWTRVPMIPLCSACKELLRHLYMVL